MTAAAAAAAAGGGGSDDLTSDSHVTDIKDAVLAKNESFRLISKMANVNLYRNSAANANIDSIRIISHNMHGLNHGQTTVDEMITNDNSRVLVARALVNAK